jgi:hypothetical protein
VAARWPHVSPQADTDRASGSRSAAKIFVFIVLNLRGGLNVFFLRFQVKISS